MINLMFIKNISRLDIIRFENETQRDNYFIDKTLVSVDSIYPPHFQNTIQFSIDDLSPSTKVNYLSLYYEYKYYYYFIDDIKYINEGLYELNITLDTITTFMFDLSINEGILERHTIKRWDNDLINRDYIRENFSLDSFELDSFDILNTNNTPCVVLHRRAPLNQEEYEEINVYELDGTNELVPNTIGNVSFTYDCFGDEFKYTLQDGSYYYLFPIFKVSDYIPFQYGVYNKDVTIKFIDSNDNLFFSIPYLDYNKFLNSLLEDLNTVNAFVIDNSITYSLFDYQGYEEDDGRFIYKIKSNYIPNRLGKSSLVKFYIDALEIQGCCIKLGEIHITSNNYNFSLKVNDNNFIKNKYINKDFDLKYIPQLIDENYFRIYYGEKLEYTTFPLHTLNDTKLNAQNIYDLFSGNRIYRLTIDNDLYDKYLTNCIVQTQETMNLYKDALTNYMQTNKGSLTYGVALAKRNVAFDTFQNSLNSVLTSKSKFEAIGKLVNTGVEAVQSLDNISTRLKIDKTNAEYTPDTTRQGNTFSSDLISYTLKNILWKETVRDILYIGRKYEQYGFLTNHLILSKNIYNDFNTRYYFNVLKFNNLKLELNYINNTTLVNNINQRLENGIRLWNIIDENDVIDFNKFNYDNIEIEFIEEEE